MIFADSFSSTWHFLREGGFFMILLFLCSLTAATVMVMKALSLKRSLILPADLEKEVEQIDTQLESGQIDTLQQSLKKGDNTLARLCAIAFQKSGETSTDTKEAIQSSAREEIVRMNSGLAILEVITTVAPLLGLLGTASGLVTVFGDLESKVNIQRGIATALSTTVVGIAIAVPSVMAHSYFSRRIEIFAARLEVLLNRVVSACQRHGNPSA